jgi:hypothetical protein
LPCIRPRLAPWIQPRLLWTSKGECVNRNRFRNRGNRNRFLVRWQNKTCQPQTPGTLRSQEKLEFRRFGRSSFRPASLARHSHTLCGETNVARSLRSPDTYSAGRTSCPTQSHTVRGDDRSAQLTIARHIFAGSARAGTRLPGRPPPACPHG